MLTQPHQKEKVFIEDSRVHKVFCAMFLCSQILQSFTIWLCKFLIRVNNFLDGHGDRYSSETTS